MTEKEEIAHLNAKFEISGELPEKYWNRWLWESDPEESFHNSVYFNENQLIGLLVCRYKYHTRTSITQAAPDRLTIMDKPVSIMTWRELKDTVANIQFEWPIFLERLQHNTNATQNLDQVLSLIDSCACRFGRLCTLVDDGTILDDTAETEPCQDIDFVGMHVLTTSSLRRMVGSLLILYRHLHLLAVCDKLPAKVVPTNITKYHYEASMDEFHLLCMHISLPVAARLNYRHDFKDMYNHVSQVVYFHNSQYKQQPRRELKDFSSSPPVHVLPAIRQLYPRMPIKYEEDHFNPNSSQGWYWLLLAGRVYLVTPDPRVLYSDNILGLLDYYESHVVK